MDPAQRLAMQMAEVLAVAGDEMTGAGLRRGSQDWGILGGQHLGARPFGILRQALLANRNRPKQPLQPPQQLTEFRIIQLQYRKI